MTKINTQTPAEVMADGSVVFRIDEPSLTLEGRLAPDAALALAKQILELHEMREALLAKRKAP